MTYVMRPDQNTDTDRAKAEAKAQLDSITAMMDRLEHAQKCTDGACLYFLRGQYHDTDRAIEAIQEGPLCIEVRSSWQAASETLEAAEFNILLCTGGPAVRIRGELGQYNEPARAWLEYQDWGTPWTRYSPSEIYNDVIPSVAKASQTTLLAYAQQFYFNS